MAAVNLTQEDREFLARPWIARMSVVDPQGYPLTVPVWYMLEEDVFLITTFRATRKVDYVLANPKGCLQIGGEPAQGGIAYVFKGDFAVEPDPDAAFMKRVTYHYEDRATADQHLAEWLGNEIVLLRFTPRTRTRFQV